LKQIEQMETQIVESESKSSESKLSHETNLEQSRVLGKEVTELEKRFAELRERKIKDFEVYQFHAIADELMSISIDIEKKTKLRDELSSVTQTELEPFWTARDELYNKLDLFFNLKCMVCDEFNVPVYLLMKCTKSSSNHPFGTCTHALHICEKCAHHMRIQRTVICPICRTQYRNILGNREFNFYTDVRMISCIDRFVEQWYQETGYIQIARFGEIFKCSHVSKDGIECGTWFSSLRKMAEHMSKHYKKH